MLTREHHFKIQIGHAVRSIVVEERIPINSRKSHSYWATVRLPNLRERQFVGVTPEEVAQRAARYLLKHDTLPIDGSRVLKPTLRMQLIQKLNLRDE